MTRTNLKVSALRPNAYVNSGIERGGKWMTVISVVADVKHSSVTAKPVPRYFFFVRKCPGAAGAERFQSGSSDGH